jgi:arylsulfatase A-like enzyme
LFINVSATHQPTHIDLPGAKRDSVASQAAALAYADGRLPPLIDALRRRGPTLMIVCGDHGAAFGDDGYVGVRLGHPVVWTVPYAEFILPALAEGQP